MTEETNQGEAQTEVKRMTEAELWKSAQRYHELMYDEIENPGDMIGTCAVMFTNTLIAGVVSGMDPALVDTLLGMIRADVEQSVDHMTKSQNMVQ